MRLKHGSMSGLKNRTIDFEYEIEIFEEKKTQQRKEKSIEYNFIDT